MKRQLCNSLCWPVYIINSVDHSHWHSAIVSLETYHLYLSASLLRSVFQPKRLKFMFKNLLICHLCGTCLLPLYNSCAILKGWQQHTHEIYCHISLAHILHFPYFNWLYRFVWCMYCAVMKLELIFGWLANLSSLKQLHVGKESRFLSQEQNDIRILLVNLFLN